MNWESLSWFDRYVWLRAKSAKAIGMTHYGMYFFVPVYLAGVENGDGMQVMTRAPIMEFLMTPMHYMEGWLRSMRGDEPCFQFAIGEEIKC